MNCPLDCESVEMYASHVAIIIVCLKVKETEEKTQAVAESSDTG